MNSWNKFIKFMLCKSMGEICYRFMRLVCHRVIYREKLSNLLITGNTAFFFQSFNILFIVVFAQEGHFQSKVIGMFVASFRV